MAMSLSKGENVSLSKKAQGLRKIIVGLGWEARSIDGEPFDLDSSCFMLIESGKVKNDACFVFYNNLLSTCGSVKHFGDNLTGEGEIDDGMIAVSLNEVPAYIQKLTFIVTIFEAAARRQNFGMVR